MSTYAGATMRVSEADYYVLYYNTVTTIMMTDMIWWYETHCVFGLLDNTYVVIWGIFVKPYLDCGIWRVCADVQSYYVTGDRSITLYVCCKW